MKKQNTKHPREEKTEVSHLDATLTEITATTADRLKKWRKPLIGGVVAVFAIGIVYSLVNAFAESREASFNERVYSLVGSPAAQKDGYTLDRTEVSKLLGDVKGNRAEPFVLKSVGNFYLDAADKLVDKAEKAAADAAQGVAKTPATTPAVDPQATQANIDAAREQALKIAEDAAKRFPADSDMQSWATKLKAKVEGDRKTNWLPSKWKYTPPPPKAVEELAAPSTATPPPAAVPPPAPVPVDPGAKK